MRFAKSLLLLSSFALCAFAQTTPTWDNSGNNLLNGTYYFRQVYYVLGSSNGTLSQAVAAYGTITFDGKGTFSMALTGQRPLQTENYAIAASGYGYLQNPITGDTIYGLVSQQGLFVGSDTENQQGYNDILIAAPIGANPANLSSFKGSYTAAFLDLTSGNPAYTLNATLEFNPDGAGNLGAASASGYIGLGGNQKVTQSYSGVKYIFSNGAGVVNFPASNNALLTGQYYLYISPDGNFIFGGSPGGADMIVGVRTGSGTPALSGLYYQAGVDQDESHLASGYAILDSYFGALKASAGSIVGHQRFVDLVDNGAAIDYTYTDSYTLGSNGTYSTAYMNYVVGNSGIRIGSGIGPFLGLSVALPAPTFNGDGVYLDPTGIVNAASSAPFTAGIAPGELLTLYGSNLAAGLVSAPSIPFPTTLGNVQVMINGIAAPIYYVSPGQISVIVPYSLTGAIAAVQVINNNIASNTITNFTAATAPGVFTVLQTGIGDGAILHQDGTAVTTKSPAQPGETVSVFLTGLGAVNPSISDGDAGPGGPLSYATATFTADISGTAATIQFAGLAPNLAGLYQMNVTIPTGLTAGDNMLDIGGPDSYTAEVTIPIAGTATANAAPAMVKPKASQKGAFPGNHRGTAIPPTTQRRPL
ncbi:MAG TPA: IPT/TIG domain-containing protein [Candidatus Limnocylindrales bacterium]|nr:IPT/TIG domain-containing protein [Candidatus Limnocylindrales bacterium]